MYLLYDFYHAVDDFAWKGHVHDSLVDDVGDGMRSSSNNFASADLFDRHNANDVAVPSVHAAKADANKSASTLPVAHWTKGACVGSAEKNARAEEREARLTRPAPCPRRSSITAPFGVSSIILGIVQMKAWQLR